MTGVEVDRMRAMPFANQREFLQEAGLANTAGTKDVKNEEGEGFCGESKLKERKLTAASDKTGVTRLFQAVSQAWRHTLSDNF